MFRAFLIILLSIIVVKANSQGTIEDRFHFSRLFDENRNYRVFLPTDYNNSGKKYPVLYWFHGSGGSSKQETYKADFEKYTANHDIIIVNVDGTTKSGSTWDYGLAFEYDTRTQEGRAALTGKHFSKYIRELIGIIDSSYRTVPDRDHRAVSGQSMGGLMAPWVASQNKDLFSSVSMFSPSPDAAMFGPEGKEVCFVNSELYRSLKGLPVRITIADGDRYRQYYSEQKAIWELADLTKFEYHVVGYPDHKAVDIPAQFDFHMAEFSKKSAFPERWHHADPFTDFKVWNYHIKAVRDQAAFTILENVSSDGMLISSRTFLPDGPFASGEQIFVTIDTIYNPGKIYILTDFNRTTKTISTQKVKADARGSLKFSVSEGGHAIGIKQPKEGPKLFILFDKNREELYCEEGKTYDLKFIIVNAGTTPSGPVKVTAITPKKIVSLDKDTFSLTGLKPGEIIEVRNKIGFTVNEINTEYIESKDFISKISLNIVSKGSSEISDLFIKTVPVAETLEVSELIILDGCSREVPVYNNQAHEVTIQSISGGRGNGNSKAEPGETIELYLKLPQGLGENDKNTYHPAFLMNPADYPFLSVNELKYNLKGAEYSGAANIQSRIAIDEEIPAGTGLNLWLKCESYEFRDEGFNRPVQRHKYHYNRAVIHIGQ